jgi:hypothetical protein
MKINRQHTNLTSNFLVLALSLVFLVCFPSITNAQDESTPSEEVPTLINKIPKKLPLKIEITVPEKAEDFPEKIKVKVTNTGKKPIYSLRLFLDMADAPEKMRHFSSKGEPALYGFDLTYGRKELSGAYLEAPTTDDIPIEPNEFHIFEVDKDYVKTVKKSILSEGRQFPKVYELIFFDLTYGDQTGFTKGGGTFSKKT